MKPYYEGWYMKQQQGDDVLAVIPGRAQDHAFIQVITQNGSHYLTYPLASYQLDRLNGPRTASQNATFKARSADERFRNTASSEALAAFPRMRVGDSTFCPVGMELDIREPDLELVGAFCYRDTTPLRSDIMGPFGLIPMETKHTVFSMRHRVDGCVRLNDQLLRFDNAAGYMEGDRGHSFPQSYTWIQSVDLPSHASVMLAIAEIPLGPIRFTGCIAVIMLNGVEYRLATYRGVRILHADERLVEIAQGDMNLRVEVPKTNGHRLQAPDQGAMRRSIHESPAGPAHFTFTKHGATLLDSMSEHASYEYVVR